MVRATGGSEKDSQSARVRANHFISPLSFLKIFQGPRTCDPCYKKVCPCCRCSQVTRSQKEVGFVVANSRGAIKSAEQNVVASVTDSEQPPRIPYRLTSCHPVYPVSPQWVRSCKTAAISASRARVEGRAPTHLGPRRRFRSRERRGDRAAGAQRAQLCDAVRLVRPMRTAL